jgi:hypothetical protein
MTPLQLHIAGATVRHHSPFSELEVPAAGEPLPVEVREEWVCPLYFGLDQPHIPAFLAENLDRASDDLIDQLLTHFDWRSRVAGTLLVALLKRETFAERIGRLLLRSDVCYAGTTYCLALATFNSSSSIQVLKRYLDYYPERKDLWFDQISAMAALAYLDVLNGTSEAIQFVARWDAFVADKRSWDLGRSTKSFGESMALLQHLRPTREG